MAASSGKGARGKATKLHSLIVRERAGFVCENCGRTKEEGQMQCAHIVSRNYGQTRTDLRNAVCLCAKCHWFFGKWPVEFARFVEDKIGLELYEELKEKALEGRGKKLDWVSELIRLEHVYNSGLSG